MFDILRSGMQRRTGDLIEIDGAYQHNALRSKNPVQRWWHKSKLLLIDELLKPSQGDRILDVGCGSGVCSAHMSERGAEVVGIDGNPAAIEFARAAYPGRSPGLSFEKGLVDELAFPRASFSKAICLEVIEHLYENQVIELLEGVRRSLVRGGLLLLTTPNYRSAWPAIEFALDAFGLVPKLDGDQHVTHFYPRRLTALCKSVGFEPVALRSICTIGPWLGPISDSLARRATISEIRHGIPCGSVIAHLYREV
jgi:2-polyprenyl-3-methyl-5-hydroxy-6-metoxy-1,4-benzoquinol methylase